MNISHTLIDHPMINRAISHRTWGHTFSKIIWVVATKEEVEDNGVQYAEHNWS
jgi:hypothetical protein